MMIVFVRILMQMRMLINVKGGCQWTMGKWIILVQGINWRIYSCLTMLLGRLRIIRDSKVV